MRDRARHFGCPDKVIQSVFGWHGMRWEGNVGGPVVDYINRRQYEGQDCRNGDSGYKAGPQPPQTGSIAHGAVPRAFLVPPEFHFPAFLFGHILPATISPPSDPGHCPGIPLLSTRSAPRLYNRNEGPCNLYTRG